jgi:ABC-2 type transport system ATP-binding protein
VEKEDEFTREIASELQRKARAILLKEKRENALVVRDLSKRYKNKWILKRMNFEVKKGEIFALLGPSGSGKSTLLRILAAVERPTEGFVDIHSEGFKEIHQIIGFVPQAEGVYEELSVWENIVYFGKLYNLSYSDIERRGTKILRQLFIYECRNEEVKNLSGGMQRRLNICCALLHDPQIILMDEPTTGLDPVTKMALWRTIKDINSLGKTIIFTTHFMEETTALADRVALIRDGVIEVVGDTKELINALGTPVKAETEPGNTNAIVNELDKVRGVMDIASRFGQTLVVINKQPDEPLMHEIRKALLNSGERILKLEPIIPDMNDVFFYYTEKKREKP